MCSQQAEKCTFYFDFSRFDRILFLMYNMKKIIKRSAYLMEGYEITNIHEDVAKTLVDRIKKHGENARIYYSDLCSLIDNVVGCRQIASYIGDISCWCYEIDAPMLSALVINKDENMPGKGFFTLYAELNDIARVEDEDKLKIWIDEYRKVINYREWDNLLSYLGIAT